MGLLFDISQICKNIFAPEKRIQLGESCLLQFFACQQFKNEIKRNAWIFVLDYLTITFSLLQVILTQFCFKGLNLVLVKQMPANELVVYKVSPFIRKI